GLGNYTTAVRLDDMPRLRSFSSLTRELLRAESERAAKFIHDARPGNMRSVRRALDACPRLTYLLDPVRVHIAGVAAASDQLTELQASLERLANLGAIANVILRAGRRSGALHMMSVLRIELFGAATEDATEPPRDLRAGLRSLSRWLHAEISPAFEDFTNRWTRDALARLSADLEACAEQLR
ncbi:MAG: hypothetical protein ACREBE_22025, partial [bacterium]